jgi:hypothetical protein
MVAPNGSEVCDYEWNVFNMRVDLGEALRAAS